MSNIKNILLNKVRYSDNQIVECFHHCNFLQLQFWLYLLQPQKTLWLVFRPSIISLLDRIQTMVMTFEVQTKPTAQLGLEQIYCGQITS